MLITITSGQETFPAKSAKMHTFFVPTRKFGGKETHVGIFARAGAAAHGFKAQGGATIIPAGQGMKQDIVGKWSTQVFDVPEGMVLKVFGWRSTNGIVAQASVLIRARSTAALQRLSMDLTGYDRATTTQATVEGRFDVLTMQEIGIEGAALNPMTVKTMGPQAVSRIFSTTQLDAQLAAKSEVKRVVVENQAGETVVVHERRGTRNIDV